MSDYKIKDLEKILKSNVKKDAQIVFVAGDLAAIGKFDSTDKNELLNAITNSIFKASNDKATIMTQTMSFQICNTNIPFKRDTWANLGAFGNFLLRQKNSIRSFHPFASYTALGVNAQICDTKTPFAYGLKSPYANALDFDDFTMISIGKEPNLTCSIVHHVEFITHVPYRYIKEFTHPVQWQNDEIEYKKFYLQVLYKEYVNLQRNLNVKIFKYFKEKFKGEIKSVPLGRNFIHFYDLKAFYKSCIECFLKDIYVWMSQEPQIKPYIK